MKPCRKNRNRIAGLVLGELDSSQAHELEVHLATCPGCRTYQEELQRVAQGLSETGTTLKIAPSPDFHHRLARSVTARKPARPWEIVRGNLCAGLWNHRLVGAGAGALAVLAAGLFLLLRPHAPSPTPPSATQEPRTRPWDRSVPPILAVYQRAAERSLDDLDALLTLQATQPHVRQPVFTAGRAPEE